MNELFVQQFRRRFNISLLLLVGAGSFMTSQVKAQPIETQQVETQQAINLTVEVTNLRNQEGNVCFKLFSGSEGFPNDDDSALQRTCVAIDNLTALPSALGSASEPDLDTETSETSTDPTPSSTESMTEPADTVEAAPENASDATFRYTFENLPAGNYAVAIYHDRNADERLNRTLFSIPAVGYGFSNDAPANFGPAEFEDAVFALEESNNTIQIRMRYP